MTRRKLSILLLAAALAAGCGRTQSAQRKDQNYQVVQEGQASGVTSTINGPGETTPPITNTAVDTTTNLTLLDNPAPLGTQGGAPNTVAGTLPQAGATAPPGSAPRMVPTSTLPPMTSSTTRTAPTTTDTVGTTQAQPQPRPRTHPSQTQPEPTTTAAPPPTDTTTSTQPPPLPADTVKTDTSTTTKTDTTKTDTQQQTNTSQKTDTTTSEKPPV